MKRITITGFLGIFLFGIYDSGFADIQKTASYKISVTIPSSIESKPIQRTNTVDAKLSASSSHQQKIVEEAIRNNQRVIVETHVVK